MDPISLAQAGPVAILLVGIGLLFRAFVKGDVVPGHIYVAEREQRQKAETQAERNAEALAILSKAGADAHATLVAREARLSGAPNDG